ncbi:DNA-3-methyladenine glycosylase 2 family protein [Bowmanella sp. Y57]|uniref:DNA-3-methyladenine glycosylase 2 family protein n=2 Tax=Bowmanella yangjiangensis TaxID=2811230 RepID=A0ABS3CYV3_9ALTE|nr:AlkA N-terminal domain-containing protein [Bowmanella yangjiangensis]MBN7821515.1 DNA-3-methyladenine glycosylase 2 family protein [Bowmanella yangjiangensis]
MNPLQYQQARLSRDRRFDGRFFVAVKTTGIFCRPICPAVAPKEQNVEYYPLAEQAMQAGYRPCLRCRPDSSPQSWAWKGVDTSVERALRLLSEHPELSLGQIADKLGMTDRYLRKLFQERVGMAPKRYQLFKQLLQAKQLLHQTNLNVEQVALACGFQSARRLQDNFRQHLQLSPGEIRNHAVPGQKMQVQLSFRPPYHWPMLRDFLALRAITDMEWVTDNSYARVFRHAGAKGYFCAEYQADKHCFNVSLELDDLSQFTGVIAHIRRVLDVDADSGLIGERLRQAGISAEQHVQGLRLPGVWSPFEAGCRAILGQQVSVKAAIGQVSLLVTQLGEQGEKGRYFPAPEVIAHADLSFLKMPASRRDTLRRFAEYWAAFGEPTEPDELLALKGIGPWTVNYMKLRGYSNPDVWLDTDLVIKKQLQQQPVDADCVAPWRSYLTFQLWSQA